tara:strand:+ start:2990 stop:3157 length:168 start_codon:yes stop_codon:yes gene_type:complete
MGNEKEYRAAIGRLANRMAVDSAKKGHSISHEQAKKKAVNMATRFERRQAVKKTK